MQAGVEVHAVDYLIIFFYFAGILLFGSIFGKGTRTTKDFFLGGQRFSWWLISLSMIATTVGSYSFVKYSQVAYQYGFSSTMTYLNDWLWMPLFFFVWLPIIYYTRITSIPEYFELRFDRTVRAVTTVLILLYLVGYVGINLYSIGIVMKSLLGWNILFCATIVAIICGVYVSLGGQTSVIMTDLIQGIILLIAGFLILFIGIDFLGGAEAFLSLLPPSFKKGIAHFNAPSDFNFVGVFYQDGLANGIAVYFFNQGMVMRFLSAKSEREARKAVTFVILALMPITAVAVSNSGWIGRALVSKGFLPDSINSQEVFALVVNRLCPVGLFGFVMAALTASLMSTIDTLINAISAIWVNDAVKLYIKRDGPDSYYLKMARISSIAASFMGLLLVPLFASFKSIYSAHGAFTAAVTPPVGIAIIFAILVKRFSARGALFTIGMGISAILLSFFVPEVIRPFAAGTSMHASPLSPLPFRASGWLILIAILSSLIIIVLRLIRRGRFRSLLLPGFLFILFVTLYCILTLLSPSPLVDYRAYFFMRACFGLAVSFSAALASILLFRGDEKDTTGLCVGSIEILKRLYKGRELNYRPSKKVKLKVVEEKGRNKGERLIGLNPSALTHLNAGEGDILHVSHSLWLYGGYRSFQAFAGEEIQEEGVVVVPSHLLEEGRLEEGDGVVVEKVI